MRCALAYGSAYAVHCGIAAAQHHHAFAFHADIWFVAGFAKPHDLLRIGDQERQSVENPVRIFIFQPAAHRLIGADAKEYRIVIFQQIFKLYITTHFGIKFELNTHAGEDLATAGHHLFFQFESWNTEGQQAADFRMAIKDHRLHAVAGQHVGARQPCRTCADNRYPFVRLAHAGDIRAPAHFERFIVDIALNVTDGHCAELIVQRTGAFAQAVLRADAATHFRQGVGLVR